MTADAATAGKTADVATTGRLLILRQGGNLQCNRFRNHTGRTRKSPAEIE